MIDRTTLLASIDHSILKPNMTEIEVLSIAREIYPLHVASLCVMPCYLRQVKNVISNLPLSGNTKLSTVIGFPCGNIQTINKLKEMEECQKIGIEEYDVVVNYSNVISGNWTQVVDEIRALYNDCVRQNALLKIIFETCYLQDRHIITLCEVCADIMSDGFVKTSTGFGSAGANSEIVKLMKEHSKHLSVKASGGIKTLTHVETMLFFGATRIGTSATLSIINEYDEMQELIKSRKKLPDNDEPPF